MGSNAFIVCGLGSLGQSCVKALHEFGGVVNAIEQTEGGGWEVAELENCINQLIIGDCRRGETLKQAGIENCRAILLVTSNERINLETAFAARSLNSDIRIIVRSAKQNLNDLLSSHLGNFIAFEPTQLPAPAFALAALSDEIIGFFTIDEQLVRVLQVQIEPRHPWRDIRLVYELNTRNRRILEHYPAQGDRKTECQDDQSMNSKFDLEARIKVGDVLTYVELADVEILTPRTNTVTKGFNQKLANLGSKFLWHNLQNSFASYREWLGESRTRMAAFYCAIVVVCLIVIGTCLFQLYYPGINLVDSIYATIALLLSGYGDLFGEIINTDPAPPWLRFVGLLLTISGTALLGLLYGLLTESLLSARFQFLSRRPPLPEQGFVVLVGLGRVGQGVAKLLQNFRQPLVAIALGEVDPNFLPDVPIITGSFNSAIEKLDLTKAKSLIAVTDDEMVNLELAMMTYAANPASSLVIRTFDQNFANNLSQLLPYAEVLCANAISAEAFAAAAYGENVISVFRLANQTVLVTEYCIETGDTLIGLVLAEVSYGYGVVPILHQELQGKVRFLPSDDTRLNDGDRLVVLATIKDLQAIELGSLAEPTWYVFIEKSTGVAAEFEGANVIVRVCNCPMPTARLLMENLPNRLDVPLYKLQAQRLVRELLKAQVTGYIIAS